jgi:hypothetical protein
MMGDPYLTSDESLILSTHDICIEGVSLDLMLTSRRLILIDNSSTPFQLHTIPLETIITVFAGTDVKGDPIITLSHMDPSGTGAPHPMDFIFIRQKGEPRTRECNEWAASLSTHAAGARDGALSAGTLPYDPVKVIQPRMSATYRIETFSPRKPELGEYPARAAPVTPAELPHVPSGEDIPAVTREPVAAETGEMFETFDSSVLPPYEPEEPEILDAELCRVGEFLTTPVASEALIESPAPVAPECETPDEIPSVHEHTPDIASVSMVNSPLLKENTGCEAPIPPQQGAGDDTDDNSRINDAKSIWADAARSAVSSPTPVFVIPLPEIFPVAAPKEDEPVARSAPAVPVTEEPVAETRKEPFPAGAMITDYPDVVEPAEQPAPQTAPVPVAILPPAKKNQAISSHTPLIAAIVIIVLVVLGIAVVAPSYLMNPPAIPPSAAAPVITVQPPPVSLPAPVPDDGVWVRIEYPQTFIGEVGNPELMHPVSGSGVRLYKILWSDRIVQASAQKQDNSGDTLLVEVYNNGTLIKRSSIRVPMGRVEILIDPVTGQPPGISYGDIP